jgi:hypothetical protein
MELNELTCPQCGLVNNYLSEACAQCGIIFVKNSAAQAASNDPANQALAEQDERKRKDIEEAEAILKQTDPAAENGTSEDATLTMPDSAEKTEDTIEMEIPAEPEPPEIKSETASDDEVKSEENQNSENPELEMEAIETSIEMVTEPTDVEELFLSEVKADPSEGPTDTETGEKSIDQKMDTQDAVESSDKMAESLTMEPENKDQKQDDTTADKKSGTEPPADTKPQGDQKEEASETTEPTLVKDADGEEAEPENAEKAPADETRTAEQKISIEEETESTAAKKAPIINEAWVPIKPEKEPEAVDSQEEALVKQQEIQVLEALKKQRETQAKAEALKKEKAAQAKAAALKKKKLDQIKLEALKKQKAAQAKAEALKKRKEAQAKAISLQKQKTAQARAEALKKQKEAQVITEASARDIQVASGSVEEAASPKTKEGFNVHEKLLGLLKRYKGKAIGINYDNSTEIKEAELIEANEEFFSVMVKDKKLQYSYPLKSILTIIEGQEGVETGQDDKKSKFDAVIKVYPLVSL